jgi:acetyl-CoA carboxylase biotin carboxyl carrier protein
MPLSYKEVAEILKIIDASSCEEVILELENTRLVVRRGGASDELKHLTSKAESPARTPEKQTQSSPNKSAAKNPTPSSDDDSMTVRAPMVGTFYCSPSPDEAPFVTEGAKIAVGDTLCLIEVMKLYTTI